MASSTGMSRLGDAYILDLGTWMWSLITFGNVAPAAFSFTRVIVTEEGGGRDLIVFGGCVDTTRVVCVCVCVVWVCVCVCVCVVCASLNYHQPCCVCVASVCSVCCSVCVLLCVASTVRIAEESISNITLPFSSPILHPSASSILLHPPPPPPSSSSGTNVGTSRFRSSHSTRLNTHGQGYPRAATVHLRGPSTRSPSVMPSVRRARGSVPTQTAAEKVAEAVAEAAGGMVSQTMCRA